MAGWYDVVDTEVVHDGWSTLRIDTVRMPDGSSARREVADHLHAVAVVPVTDDDQVVLLKQYRHPLGRYLLEIPAGVLDVEGEPLETAARRELAEETEHEARTLTPLVSFHNSAGWTTERTHLFLGEGLTRIADPVHVPEAEEADMEVVLLPLADAVEAARDGGFTDVKTALGLVLVGHRRGL